MTQGPTEIYSLMAQQLILDIVINLSNGESIDLDSLKSLANEMTSQAVSEENYEFTRNELKSKCLTDLKGMTSKPAVVTVENNLVEAKT